MATENPHVFAFWKYDKFPYALGSAGHLLPDGRFKAVNYDGATFQRSKLIAIYPVAMGLEINEKLQAQKEAYLGAMADLHEKHIALSQEILPELKLEK
jgi:hypothetical protein